jgi:hypothetical protein
MPRRLHVTKLTSIGAVAEGDNPEAEILFFKSKQAEPLEGRTHGGGPVAETTVDLSSLDDEVRASVEAATAESVAKIEELTAQVTELKAQVVVDEEEILPDDLPEAVAKRLADQEDRIAKAEASAVAAEAKVEKAEDQRLTEMYTKRAVELRPVLGDPEVMGPVLKDLASSAPDSYPVLDTQLDTLVNMDGLNTLLREHGDNGATGSAVDQILVYAKEIRKDDKDLTLAAAKAQAWQDHPELKTQAREEGD